MFRSLIQRLLATLGYRLEKVGKPGFEPQFEALREKVKPFTMTSPERQYALWKAVQYVEAAGIPGAFVECGVWKGGSSMLAALTLSSKDRNFYLYDTFAGMSEPTEKDVNLHGGKAEEKWKGMNQDGVNLWDYASLEEVKKNVLSTGYPEEKINFIQGKVEDTIPNTVPDQIAILRLDTDWYESTKHELEHLFPRIQKGGVLIIDDYGHWQGAKEAVDEYIKKNNLKLLLNRIDYTGRIAVV